MGSVSRHPYPVSARTSLDLTENRGDETVSAPAKHNVTLVPPALPPPTLVAESNPSLPAGGEYSFNLRAAAAPARRRLTCAVCRDVLYQPVLLVPCLHTFCGHCAKKRLEGRWACPECEQPPTQVEENWPLRNELARFLQQYPVRERPPSEKQTIASFYMPGEPLQPPTAATVLQLSPDSHYASPQLADSVDADNDGYFTPPEPALPGANNTPTTVNVTARPPIPSSRVVSDDATRTAINSNGVDKNKISPNQQHPTKVSTETSRTVWERRRTSAPGTTGLRQALNSAFSGFFTRRTRGHVDTLAIESTDSAMLAPPPPYSSVVTTESPLPQQREQALSTDARLSTAAQRDGCFSRIRFTCRCGCHIDAWPQECLPLCRGHMCRCGKSNYCYGRQPGSRVVT